jgi:hypothetical protein
MMFRPFSFSRLKKNFVMKKSRVFVRFREKTKKWLQSESKNPCTDEDAGIFYQCADGQRPVGR